MARIRINHPKWDAMLDDHARHNHLGADFLTWHSDFIDRFKELLKLLQANNQPRPREKDIEPWKEIPQILKGASMWKDEWDELEDNLQHNIGSFENLTELANDILPLHNDLHRAVQEIHKDRYIAIRETAPMSTYFWQLHGLIERWHQAWLERNAQSSV